jgi:hypothetical protein
MTQLTENLTVWQLWYFKAVTSYRGKRFQVPTRLTTVTRQTGEYKVDLTRHPIFFHSPLASWQAVVSHTVMLDSLSCYLHPYPFLLQAVPFEQWESEVNLHKATSSPESSSNVSPVSYYKLFLYCNFCFLLGHF